MTLVPDLTQTMAHLEALEQDPRTRFTFQVFPETDGCVVRPEIIHGALPDVVDVLGRANARGAGITVTINRTDLRGRAAENIVALRSLAIDCDRPRARRLALPPSLSIETSPRRGHHYWLLQPGEPLLGFAEAQRQLAAYYRSDPSITDLGRVLRLAGFVNWKHGEPHLVRIAGAQVEHRYTIAEIVLAHPLPACRHRAPLPAARPQHASEVSYAAWSRRAPVKQGSRNNTAFRIAVTGFRAGLHPAVVGAEVRGFCQRAGILAEAGPVLRSAWKASRRRPPGGPRLLPARKTTSIHERFCSSVHEQGRFTPSDRALATFAAITRLLELSDADLRQLARTSPDCFAPHSHMPELLAGTADRQVLQACELIGFLSAAVSESCARAREGAMPTDHAIIEVLVALVADDREHCERSLPPRVFARIRALTSEPPEDVRQSSGSSEPPA